MVIDENDKKPQNVTKVYHVIDAGESLFLDEVENCRSNQWFKIGKTKPLRTKRVFANASSSGIYYCKVDGPLQQPILHHHLLVIERAPEIRINNPPLIDGEMSNITCNCSASLKSYNFIVTMNLLFADFYIYSETLDSYKFKPTVMTLTSSQRINKVQPFMNGSITCLWLLGERSTVEVKWWELARVSLQSQIMVPATTAYPDLTTTTPERKVTCSAHALPPIFKCNWKSHLRAVNFITDESGCALRIFNTGVHVFTCMAFNLIGGKMYTASWSGELIVLTEEKYVANDLVKEALPLEDEASIELLEPPCENEENDDKREKRESRESEDNKDSLSNGEGRGSSPRRVRDDDKPSADDSKGPHIVSLCGLPYSAIKEDVLDFMEGCNVLGGARGIHIAVGSDGRPNGIAFVELATREDVEKAKERHKSNMGKRYIEVRQVTEGDMRRMMDRWKPRRDPVNAVVLVKGLPYSCTTEDIGDFFRGLEIEANGIMIVLDGRGRVCGDGFVHFTSMRSVDLALQRHKEKIKHRYIEVYRSDLREMYPRVTNQLSPAGPWSDRRRDDDRYGYRSRTEGRSYGGGPTRNRGRYDETERRRYGGPYDRPSPRRSYDRGYEASPRRQAYSDRSRAPHKEFAPPYRSKTGYSVHMRGLPYVVTKEQIVEFFAPVVPVDVTIEVLRDGKRTGNANVDFATEEDVNEALRKDREKIDSRYIELYNNKNRC